MILLIVGYDSSALSLSFYLINKDNQWLERNFRFLHAFFGGTQWVQFNAGFIKGSNVYNILCPGRFNILWASVGSTITCEGDLRKNSWMAAKFGKNTKINSSNKLLSIDEDTLWPAAWKIDIQIKDLTPNNFNTYIDYFKNGHEANFALVRAAADAKQWTFMGANKAALTEARKKELKLQLEKDRNANIHSNLLEQMNKHANGLFDPNKFVAVTTDNTGLTQAELKKLAGAKIDEAKALIENLKKNEGDVTYLKLIRKDSVTFLENLDKKSDEAFAAVKKAEKEAEQFRRDLAKTRWGGFMRGKDLTWFNSDRAKKHFDDRNNAEYQYTKNWEWQPDYGQLSDNVYKHIRPITDHNGYIYGYYFADERSKRIT